MPNEYDAEGALSFAWTTLRDHAGQGPCRYWIPFSNAMSPHERVPGASNPDYQAGLDNAHPVDYLITERGFKGKSSLLVFEAMLSAPTNWILAGGPVEYAIGAQLRRESYDRREYSRENGPHGVRCRTLSATRARVARRWLTALPAAPASSPISPPDTRWKQTG